MWDDNEADVEAMRRAGRGCLLFLVWALVLVGGFCWWLVHYVGKGGA